MCDDIYPIKLDQNFGKRWTVVEKSYKCHASCRHSHPSVDSLLVLMKTHNIHSFERYTTCGLWGMPGGHPMLWETVWKWCIK